ncbi:hypothetical protein PV10_05299 [Exophiala mesophila]|uniref:Involucrin repeat protein n=1 Tax=Exophiala mesophila TaxID=212818 RepID=A0A0D1Z778_EXOME|nr:uncharacterized protein PV10_05299 [Exophiala mesophila]KIV90667.1 hypothetical protein PV10_05299 [Exophiala mesophila]
MPTSSSSRHKADSYTSSSKAERHRTADGKRHKRRTDPTSSSALPLESPKSTYDDEKDTLDDDDISTTTLSRRNTAESSRPSYANAFTTDPASVDYSGAQTRTYPQNDAPDSIQDRQDSQYMSINRSVNDKHKSSSRNKSDRGSRKNRATNDHTLNDENPALPQNQFPGEIPSTYAEPYRPPGLASQYYGDQGQSVAFQPGVRPTQPSIVTSSEQAHLMEPSLDPRPPPEPSSLGQLGAAASYFADSSYQNTSAGPSNPSKPLKPSSRPNGQDQTVINPRTSPGPVKHGSKPSHPSSTVPLSAPLGEASSYYSPGNFTSPQRPPASEFLVSGSQSHPLQPSGSSPATAGIPLSGALVAGTAATAGALAFHQAQHHSQAHQSGPSNGPYNTGYTQMQHRPQYKHRGPLGKLVEWFRDPQAVAEFEQYTEAIGVCKYCFDPRSSAADAPRKHHYPPRRRSSGSRYGSTDRVDKAYRASSDEDRRKRSKSKNVVVGGLAGYGAAKLGRAALKANHDFDDTYSVQTGRPLTQSRVSFQDHPTHQYHSRRRSPSSDRRKHVHDHRKQFGPDKTNRKYERRSTGRRGSSSSESSRGISRRAAALGVASAVPVVSASRRRTSSRHRDGSHSPSSKMPHDSVSPSYSYVDLPATNAESGGVLGFFTSPSANKRKGKGPKGFFNFANSSSSSTDLDLGYGSGLVRRKRSDRQLSGRNKNLATAAGVAGLVKLGNDLASESDRRRRKGKPRDYTDYGPERQPLRRHVSASKPDDEWYDIDDSSDNTSRFRRGASSDKNATYEKNKPEFSREAIPRVDLRGNRNSRQDNVPFEYDNSLSPLRQLEPRPISEASIPNPLDASHVAQHDAEYALSRPRHVVSTSVPLQQPQPMSNVKTFIDKSIAASPEAEFSSPRSHREGKSSQARKRQDYRSDMPDTRTRSRRDSSPANLSSQAKSEASSFIVSNQDRQDTDVRGTDLWGASGRKSKDRRKSADAALALGAAAVMTGALISGPGATDSEAKSPSNVKRDRSYSPNGRESQIERQLQALYEEQRRARDRKRLPRVTAPQSSLTDIDDVVTKVTANGNTASSGTVTPPRRRSTVDKVHEKADPPTPETQQQRIARMAAQRVKSTPSPVYEDYRTFFLPKELAEHLQEHNDQAEHRDDLQATILEITPGSSRTKSRLAFDPFLYHQFGLHPDDDPMSHPWPVPLLGLIEATPPASRTHSERGEPDPSEQPPDNRDQIEQEGIDNTKTTSADHDNRVYETESPSDGRVQAQQISPHEQEGQNIEQGSNNSRPDTDNGPRPETSRTWTLDDSEAELLEKEIPTITDRPGISRAWTLEEDEAENLENEQAPGTSNGFADISPRMVEITPRVRDLSSPKPDSSEHERGPPEHTPQAIYRSPFAETATDLGILNEQHEPSGYTSTSPVTEGSHNIVGMNGRHYLEGLGDKGDASLDHERVRSGSPSSPHKQSFPVTTKSSGARSTQASPPPETSSVLEYLVTGDKHTEVHRPQDATIVASAAVASDALRQSFDPANQHNDTTSDKSFLGIRPDMPQPTDREMPVGTDGVSGPLITGSADASRYNSPETRNQESGIDMDDMDDAILLSSNKEPDDFMHLESSTKTPLRRLSAIRTGGNVSSPTTPSNATAIPVHFRLPVSSPTNARFAPSSPIASPNSPLTTPRTRQGRPRSTEFTGKDIRPLYLVERSNFAKSSSPIVGDYPPLPASIASSSQPSVEDLRAEAQAQEHGYSLTPTHISADLFRERARRHSYSRWDGEHPRPQSPDYLDSRSATPVPGETQRARDNDRKPKPKYEFHSPSELLQDPTLLYDNSDIDGDIRSASPLPSIISTEADQDYVSARSRSQSPPVSARSGSRDRRSASVSRSTSASWQDAVSTITVGAAAASALAFGLDQKSGESSASKRIDKDEFDPAGPLPDLSLFSMSRGKSASNLHHADLGGALPDADSSTTDLAQNPLSPPSLGRSSAEVDIVDDIDNISIANSKTSKKQRKKEKKKKNRVSVLAQTETAIQTPEPDTSDRSRASPPMDPLAVDSTADLFETEKPILLTGDVPAAEGDTQPGSNDSQPQLQESSEILAAEAAGASALEKAFGAAVRARGLNVDMSLTDALTSFTEQASCEQAESTRMPLSTIEEESEYVTPMTDDPPDSELVIGHVSIHDTGKEIDISGGSHSPRDMSPITPSVPRLQEHVIDHLSEPATADIRQPEMADPLQTGHAEESEVRQFEDQELALQSRAYDNRPDFHELSTIQPAEILSTSLQTQSPATNTPSEKIHEIPDAIVDEEKDIMKRATAVSLHLHSRPDSELGFSSSATPTEALAEPSGHELTSAKSEVDLSTQVSLIGSLGDMEAAQTNVEPENVWPSVSAKKQKKQKKKNRRKGGSVDDDIDPKGSPQELIDGASPQAAIDISKRGLPVGYSEDPGIPSSVNPIKTPEPLTDPLNSAHMSTDMPLHRQKELGEDPLGEAVSEPPSNLRMEEKDGSLFAAVGPVAGASCDGINASHAEVPVGDTAEGTSFESAPLEPNSLDDAAGDEITTGKDNPVVPPAPDQSSFDARRGSATTAVAESTSSSRVFEQMILDEEAEQNDLDELFPVKTKKTKKSKKNQKYSNSDTSAPVSGATNADDIIEPLPGAPKALSPQTPPQNDDDLVQPKSKKSKRDKKDKKKSKLQAKGPFAQEAPSEAAQISVQLVNILAEAQAGETENLDDSGNGNKEKAPEAGSIDLQVEGPGPLADSSPFLEPTQVKKILPGVGLDEAITVTDAQIPGEDKNTAGRASILEDPVSLIGSNFNLGQGQTLEENDPPTPTLEQLSPTAESQRKNISWDGNKDGDSDFAPGAQILPNDDFLGEETGITAITSSHDQPETNISPTDGTPPLLRPREEDVVEAEVRHEAATPQVEETAGSDFLETEKLLPRDIGNLNSPFFAENTGSAALDSTETLTDDVRHQQSISATPDLISKEDRTHPPLSAIQSSIIHYDSQNAPSTKTEYTQQQQIGADDVVKAMAIDTAPEPTMEPAAVVMEGIDEVMWPVKTKKSKKNKKKEEALIAKEPSAILPDFQAQTASVTEPTTASLDISISTPADDLQNLAFTGTPTASALPDQDETGADETWADRSKKKSKKEKKKKRQPLDIFYDIDPDGKDREVVQLPETQLPDTVESAPTEANIIQIGDDQGKENLDCLQPVEESNSTQNVGSLEDRKLVVDPIEDDRDEQEDTVRIGNVNDDDGHDEIGEIHRAAVHVDAVQDALDQVLLNPNLEWGFKGAVSEEGSDFPDLVGSPIASYESTTISEPVEIASESLPTDGASGEMLTRRSKRDKKKSRKASTFPSDFLSEPVPDQAFNTAIPPTDNLAVTGPLQTDASIADAEEQLWPTMKRSKKEKRKLRKSGLLGTLDIIDQEDVTKGESEVAQEQPTCTDSDPLASTVADVPSALIESEHAAEVSQNQPEISPPGGANTAGTVFEEAASASLNQSELASGLADPPIAPKIDDDWGVSKKSKKDKKKKNKAVDRLAGLPEVNAPGPTKDQKSETSPAAETERSIQHDTSEPVTTNTSPVADEAEDEWSVKKRTKKDKKKRRQTASDFETQERTMITGQDDYNLTPADFDHENQNVDNEPASDDSATQNQIFDSREVVVEDQTITTREATADLGLIDETFSAVIRDKGSKGRADLQSESQLKEETPKESSEIMTRKLSEGKDEVDSQPADVLNPVGRAVGQPLQNPSTSAETLARLDAGDLNQAVDGVQLDRHHDSSDTPTPMTATQQPTMLSSGGEPNATDSSASESKEAENHVVPLSGNHEDNNAKPRASVEGSLDVDSTRSPEAPSTTLPSSFESTVQETNTANEDPTSTSVTRLEQQQDTGRADKESFQPVLPGMFPPATIVHPYDSAELFAPKASENETYDAVHADDNAAVPFVSLQEPEQWKDDATLENTKVEVHLESPPPVNDIDGGESKAFENAKEATWPELLDSDHGAVASGEGSSGIMAEDISLDMASPADRTINPQAVELRDSPPSSIPPSSKEKISQETPAPRSKKQKKSKKKQVKVAWDTAHELPSQETEDLINETGEHLGQGEGVLGEASSMNVSLDNPTIVTETDTMDEDDVVVQRGNIDSEEVNKKSRRIFEYNGTEDINLDDPELAGLSAMRDSSMMEVHGPDMPLSVPSSEERHLDSHGHASAADNSSDVSETTRERRKRRRSPKPLTGEEPEDLPGQRSLTPPPEHDDLMDTALGVAAGLGFGTSGGEASRTSRPRSSSPKRQKSSEWSFNRVGVADRLTQADNVRDSRVQFESPILAEEHFSSQRDSGFGGVVSQSQGDDRLAGNVLPRPLRPQSPTSSIEDTAESRSAGESKGGALYPIETPRRRPSPVDSTSKDRSSALFASSPAMPSPSNQSISSPSPRVMRNTGREPEHEATTPRSSGSNMLASNLIDRAAKVEVNPELIDQAPGPTGTSLNTIREDMAEPMNAMGIGGPALVGIMGLGAAAVSSRDGGDSISRENFSHAKSLGGTKSRTSSLRNLRGTTDLPHHQSTDTVAVPDPLKTSVNDHIGGTPHLSDRDMAEVYDGYGSYPGSPRSPTRPASVRRRQSTQQLKELETRLDQLANENRALAEAKLIAEQHLEAAHFEHNRSENTNEEALRATAAQIQERDVEISGLRQQVADLMATHETLRHEHQEKLEAIQAEHDQVESAWTESSRELELLRGRHAELSQGMEMIVRQEIDSAVEQKNAEIQVLREELDMARDKIRELQSQILAQGADQILTIRDEDYFDGACQQLCQQVQGWVLRFSKYSDNRVCRKTSEVRDDKIVDRFDNAILDGSEVDHYLLDRVKRRDVFMSVVMTMIWEYVFTRYLFGMDRSQRQKLKELEKNLGEVGPASAVHQWRALTLTLLSKREGFKAQRDNDAEAVSLEIFSTLSRFLPPPQNLEGQIVAGLRGVMNTAVNLSIEMRTQRAEYIMLPPLQPEYDTKGDLARYVYFNASLMNERSGETTSNDELERNQAVVRMVLFPLVVKKGDDSGQGDDEIVVCPAQVLIARPDKGKKARGPGRIASGDSKSLRAMSTHSLGAMSGIEASENMI